MRIIISIVGLFFFFNVSAQVKTWVFFDESKCDACIEDFSAWASGKGVSLFNKSMWFNAVSIALTVENEASIKELPYVKSLSKVKTYDFSSFNNEESNTYSDVLNQINATALHEAGLTGKGVKLGVIDAGFVDVDSNVIFNHLHEGQQIKATKDFFNPTREDFFTKETRGCNHGREVMKRITGYDQKKNEYLGVASGAEFYLARTENGDKEARVEEDNWVAAIEWLHGQGVKLVNTSLGYATDFDDPVDDYIPRQMDGNTALITKAAQMAVRDKGMVIIVSAGNMGGKDWRIISAPADAREVISVGATKKNDLSKIGYSSIGADFVNYIKPEVSCFSPSGTSYSAPIITGVVACMLEKDSTLNAEKVKQLLAESSHLYPHANNFLGFGVPDCNRLLLLMNDEPLEELTMGIDAEGASVIEIGLEDNKINEVVIFHKKEGWKVVEQQVEPFKVSKSEKRRGVKSVFFTEKGELYITVKKIEGSTHTTLQAGKFIYEIIW